MNNTKVIIIIVDYFLAIYIAEFRLAEIPLMERNTWLRYFNLSYISAIGNLENNSIFIHYNEVNLVRIQK